MANGISLLDLDSLNTHPRDETKLVDVLEQKFGAWERLRQARAEMRTFDAQAIKLGATTAELNHHCW